MRRLLLALLPAVAFVPGTAFAQDTCLQILERGPIENAQIFQREVTRSDLHPEIKRCVAKKAPLLTSSMEDSCREGLPWEDAFTDALAMWCAAEIEAVAKQKARAPLRQRRPASSTP